MAGLRGQDQVRWWQGRGGLDQAYDDQEVRDILVEHGFIEPIQSHGEEAQAIRDPASQQAWRWGVERTQHGMNRFRRLLVHRDKKPEHYLACLHCACALIAFRAAGLCG